MSDSPRPAALPSNTSAEPNAPTTAEPMIAAPPLPDVAAGDAVQGTIDPTSASEIEAEEDDLPMEGAAGLLRQVLVLLDFNGMLVIKDKERKIRQGTFPHFEGGTGRGRAKFFLRPGAMEFFAELAKDPRCRVAIYTSMKKHNIDEAVSLFDITQERLHDDFVPFNYRGTTVSSHSTLASTLFGVFDQQFNTRDPIPGDEHGFKRNLNAIWKDARVKKEGFDATNTLLVEAEAFKARDFAQNTLIVNAFEIGDVQQPERQRVIMKRIASDIEKILGWVQEPSNTVPRALQQLTVISQGVDSLEISRRRQCVVCMNGVADVQLVPCRHHCLCKQCVDKMGKICPLCRVAFTTYQQCAPSESTLAR